MIKLQKNNSYELLLLEISLKFNTNFHVFFPFPYKLIYPYEFNVSTNSNTISKDKKYMNAKS